MTVTIKSSQIPQMRPSSAVKSSIREERYELGVKGREQTATHVHSSL